jgi:hypothetical protein
MGLRRNLTTVFETMSANQTQAVVLSLRLAPVLCNAGLQLWSTNATVQFAGPVHLAPVSATDTESHRYTDDCSFSLDLPPASIVTVTTAAIGSKLAGSPPPVPQSEAFLETKNYSTHFDERVPGSPPLYFSDQGGSFALARDEKNGSNQVSRGQRFVRDHVV